MFHRLVESALKALCFVLVYLFICITMSSLSGLLVCLKKSSEAAKINHKKKARTIIPIFLSLQKKLKSPPNQLTLCEIRHKYSGPKVQFLFSTPPFSFLDAPYFFSRHPLFLFSIPPISLLDTSFFSHTPGVKKRKPGVEKIYIYRYIYIDIYVYI